MAMAPQDILGLLPSNCAEMRPIRAWNNRRYRLAVRLITCLVEDRTCPGVEHLRRASRWPLPYRPLALLRSQAKEVTPVG
eukprot:scaffold198677_cov27-Tisochrysis_lutea.AAC.3